jgi:hypothetical protein
MDRGEQHSVRNFLDYTQWSGDAQQFYISWCAVPGGYLVCYRANASEFTGVYFPGRR